MEAGYLLGVSCLPFYESWPSCWKNFPKSCH